MNITEYNDKLVSLRNEYDDLLNCSEEVKVKYRKELIIELQKIFADDTTIAYIGWRQNSPWNDGDSVEFSVGPLKYITYNDLVSFYPEHSPDSDDYDVIMELLIDGNSFTDYPPSVELFFNNADFMKMLLDDECYNIIKRDGDEIIQYAYDGY